MQVLLGHTTIWDIEHYGVKEEISGALNRCGQSLYVMLILVRLWKN